MQASVWRFTARPGREAAFEAMYGPDGDWAALFRASPAYHGTLLLRTAVGAYLLLDLWDSQGERDAFCAAHRAAYDALDRAGAALAEREVHEGWAEAVPPS